MMIGDMNTKILRRKDDLTLWSLTVFSVGSPGLWSNVWQNNSFCICRGKITVSNVVSCYVILQGHTQLIVVVGKFPKDLKQYFGNYDSISNRGQNLEQLCSIYMWLNISFFGCLRGNEYIFSPTCNIMTDIDKWPLPQTRYIRYYDSISLMVITELFFNMLISSCNENVAHSTLSVNRIVAVNGTAPSIHLFAHT